MLQTVIANTTHMLCNPTKLRPTLNFIYCRDKLYQERIELIITIVIMFNITGDSTQMQASRHGYSIETSKQPSYNIQLYIMSFILLLSVMCLQCLQLLMSRPVVEGNSYM